MLRHERNAPIWLFSFVDLAFLLLIAFTQVAPYDATAPIDLASLEIPEIRGGAEPLDTPAGQPLWQLRVARAEEARGGASPFSLIEPGTSETDPAALDGDSLEAALMTLALRRTEKPLLVPHPDARAQDLLVAVGLLEETWGATRRATVRTPAPVASAAAGEAASR